MPRQKILYQGAEAHIIQKGNSIIKKRVGKGYRIKELDERIRKLRTRAETKLLKKASDKISVPQVIKSNEKSMEIIMDFIEGKRLSDHLNSFPLQKQKAVCKLLGNEIASLHNLSIIHGDLTTSNIILAEEKNLKLYIIDFGLGFHSKKAEDRAVDLHLLRQALEAKHFKNWKILFNEVLKGYKEKGQEAKKVMEQLEKVETRGRYKSNY